MRFSVEPTDRAFDEHAATKIDKVIVDGQEIAGVITADDDEGLVRAFKYDGQGKVMTEPKDPSMALIEEHRGQVTIQMKDRKWNAEREASGAKVRVGRLDNGNIVCEVFSVARRGAARRFELGQLEHLAGKSDSEICQIVGIHAGAQMENMAERFGDRTDPSVVASIAVEQTYNMLNDKPTEHGAPGDLGVA